MSSFGEKLKQERESRNISLREIATSTKINLRYLQALEENDFQNLPGGVFNRGYVKAYAEYLGLDPDALVDAYVAEEKAREGDGARQEPDVLRALAESIERRTAGDARARRRRIRRRWLIAVPALVGLVLAGGWLYVTYLATEERPAVTSDSSPDQPPPEPVPRPALAEEPVIATPPDGSTAAMVAEPPEEGPVTAPADQRPPPVVAEPASPVREAVTVPPAAEEPAPAAPSVETRLSVPDSGVGTAVVNRKLEGRSDHFTEGQQVFFWTRVVGGRPDDHVRHVWLHEGQAVGSVRLRVGGSHWRTYSKRALPSGSAGGWAVEARDPAGRLLARHEFICVPATRQP